MLYLNLWHIALYYYVGKLMLCLAGKHLQIWKGMLEKAKVFLTGLCVITSFLCSAQESRKSVLICTYMPILVGILMLMSRINFMPSQAENEWSFMTSGPGLIDSLNGKILLYFPTLGLCITCRLTEAPFFNNSSTISESPLSQAQCNSDMPWK